MVNLMAQNDISFYFAGSTTLIGESWWPLIELETVKPYFIQLSKILEDKKKKNIQIFPDTCDIFSWTLACSTREVKVVIIGQDPYYKPPMMGPRKSVAHGLAFSLRPGTPKRSSLTNIYTELRYEYPKIELPDHGYLMGWAKQGVLLLNTWLTVEADKPKSHRDKGWEKFTMAVISSLILHKPGLVFILWGEEARDMYKSCNPNGMHYVIAGNHPSFKSAYPKFNYPGFFSYISIGSNLVRNPPVPMYFVECNNYLLNEGKTPINWGFLPDN